MGMHIKIQSLVELLLKNHKIMAGSQYAEDFIKVQAIIEGMLPVFLKNSFKVISCKSNKLTLECNDNHARYYITQNKLAIIKQLQQNKFEINSLNAKVLQTREVKSTSNPTLIQKPKLPSESARAIMLQTAQFIEDKELAQALSNLANMKRK